MATDKLPKNINGVAVPMDLHAPTLRWVAAFLDSLPRQLHQPPKGPGGAAVRPHDLDAAARQVGYVADFVDIHTKMTSAPPKRAVS